MPFHGFNDYGLLRLNVDANWRVAELAEFLNAIDATYIKCGLSQYLVDNKDEEWLQTFLRRMSFKYQTSKKKATVINESLSTLSSIVAREIPALSIRSFEIHSPGWIELLGSWNVLKFIGDSIKSWRAENTKRLSIDSEEMIATKETESKERIAFKEIESRVLIEKMSMQSELFRFLAEKGGKPAEYLNLDYVEEIMTSLEKEPDQFLRQLANDPRIIDVEVVEVDVVQDDEEDDDDDNEPVDEEGKLLSDKSAEGKSIKLDTPPDKSRKPRHRN